MHLLLAYAPADGREPAGRLAGLLETLGVTVVEAEPAPQAAGVIALLTPAALTDRAVLAALQQAPAEGRPLLPLSLMAPASFPTAEDLARVLAWRSALASSSAPAQASKYHIVNPVNSTIGDHAVTVNVFGQAAGWSAAETAQLIAALRSQPSAGVPMSAAELRSLCAGLQAQMQGFDLALRQGLASSWPASTPASSASWRPSWPGWMRRRPRWLRPCWMRWMSASFPRKSWANTWP